MGHKGMPLQGILNIDKEKRTVTFSLKEYRNGGRKTAMTLTTKEFVRRYQLHIFPKGLTRIRHYGFLSSSWKKDRSPFLQLRLADRDVTQIATFEVQEKSLHRICPSCKKGTLVTLLTFDGRGSPKNYEENINVSY